MKKVGIIRCQQTEDMCGGTSCFKVALESKGAFRDIEQCELIGFVSCGGCPGKKAVTRAQLMVERGAEVIALASCIFKGTPIAFSCPFAEQMKTAIAKKVGEGVLILDYTH